MSNKYLDRVNSPSDLKSLTPVELAKFAEEVREYITEVVLQNGGHLASNLGAVEFTIALHYVFDSPNDKIVWDVGHQCYTHKIICGRRDFFKTLRQFGGCSGFPSFYESEHDVFICGHAGTAVSTALGLAVGRDLRGGKEKILAVIGDGSLTCGGTLEGLNNVSSTTRDFIIILNDNKMSISKNVGAISKSLNRLISTQGYNRLKALARSVIGKIPTLGRQIIRGIARLEEAIKSVIVPGVFFEELGIRYIGPIDGHDIDELIHTFRAVKTFDTPVIVHLITEKGRGHDHAEKMPEKFHGVAPAVKEKSCENGIETNYQSSSNTFSQEFGKKIVELAEKDERIVAITAAMKSGTGLEEFAQKFSTRFFDVGIAEEHAVMFAAGLARKGFIPCVAIYSTFLQRALDYIYHDICLQNLHVLFFIDRAGIVDDGPTHHGIYELSFLRSMPNLTIMCPKDACELRMMADLALKLGKPCLIRYPRAEAGDFASQLPVELGRAQILCEGDDVSIWGLGKESLTALGVSKLLSEKGIKATVVNARFIKPFDKELLLRESQKRVLVTIEDNSLYGGLTTTIMENLPHSARCKILSFGWGDGIIEHGNINEIKKAHGLTAEKILEKILTVLNEK